MSVYEKENPQFFDRALRSVTLDQTRKPDQVVLMLDGKLTKELYEVVQKYKALLAEIFEPIQLEKNMGLSKALEVGVEYCKFDLIARMDSDDISAPQRFEKQVLFLEQNQQIDIVGSFISEFEDDENMIYSTRVLPTNPQELSKFARKRCPLNHVTVVMKKQMLLKAGNYEEFKGIEDYFLWGKMIKAGAQLANIDDFLVNVRAGRAMMQRRGGFDYAMMEFRLQKKFLHIGFINFFEFIRNVCIRFPIRMVPKSARSFIYRVFR